MAAAPFRSFRDLHSDRRNLYTRLCPVAGPHICDVAFGWRLERGRGRDRTEAVFAGAFRQGIRRSVSGDGLERVDRLRRWPVVAAAAGVVVHRRRWLAL